MDDPCPAALRVVRAALLGLALVAVTGGCKRLKTGAQEHFAVTFSCPDDRVVVEGRDDLHYGDLVIARQQAEAPPTEVQRDPGRLARWTSDQREKRETTRRDLNSRLDMFEVRGCDHRALLGCAHPGTDDGNVDTGVVNCFEAPAASTP